MSSPSLTLTVSQRAFPAHPRVDRYFAAASSEAARHRLTQCVLRGDGPALLLGAPGVGKTMLLEVLAAELATKLSVVRLASTQLCTRRALLQAILHGLGAPYRDREEGELRLALTDLLTDSTATGEGVALLVDEAQSLPVRLLEELRVLSNVASDGAPRVRLVLVGTHALDEAFTAPELDAFSQRIAARCYLEPLNREETASYVRAHIAVAGGDPDRLLATDVYGSITRASDGLPRLVNQVCDRAIVLATEQGRTVIDAAAIGEAWSDLHQLAAPWQSPATSRIAATTPKEETGSSIEFGVLDDEAPADAFEDDLPESLHDNLRTSDGVWNAGDKLRDLPALEAEEADALEPIDDEDDDEPCVAYAFPGASTRFDDDEEALLQEADELYEEVAAASHRIEAIQGVDEPVAHKPAPRDQPTAQAASPQPSLAADPFAEDFDEEEVVLDPYSELERVIPAAPVVNSRPTDLGRALAAIDAAVDGLMADEAFTPAAKPAPAPVKAAVADADDILIVEIEDDEQPSVRREDYAQLFAKLRQG
ncbi:hypothetical protein Pla108_34550 [Botrimarina colliarenosi]|uniref:AAA+ ATPase domain-containing protein n=1 Tax=Botrimarina colliarenosi TaxID=2528001 RepID=A0A5C6A7E5_9BACT|nr:AAA family ATPase [Botrimarina colliarenosi]TWT95310.1 hypothetical protein Pla108_34550 [Botrimarina colliarenosi]